MVEKVNLDNVAAQIVREFALRENRSASNAASTLIRRAAWLAREAKTDKNQQDGTRISRS
jgi:hypothetical protein